MRIKVLIIDDQKIMRQGLRSLLEKQPDIEVVAEAASASEALVLIREARPDLVIIDIGMPAISGVKATHRILSKAPSVKMIALLTYSGERFIKEILRAGASGYLFKDCAFEEVHEAIGRVMQGRTYVTPRIVDNMVKGLLLHAGQPPSPGLLTLTNRQIEVLRLLAEGKTTRDIARLLSLSATTVESHRRQVSKKLNIRTISGLTRFAIREGLNSPEINYS